ncbi:MAG: CoA pyrophosphatase [Anaerolineales bacterium]|nr:CoA pyrophosphatase [Anaerolineales bacterium]
MTGDCARSGIGRIFPETVQRALDLVDFNSGKAQRLMAPRPRTFMRPSDVPDKPKQAGVLLLLYSQNGELYITLTLRTENLGNHSGQISFPGGARNAGETVLEAALRETHEELGVFLDFDNILGMLAPLYIPVSDYEMHPFVAFCPFHPNFIPAPAEVAKVLTVPAACLLDPAVHREETREIRGYQIAAPYYFLNGHKVWGATAIVLSELEQRLRKIFDLESINIEEE